MIELKGTKCMQCSIIKDCELKKELEKRIRCQDFVWNKKVTNQIIAPTTVQRVSRGKERFSYLG